MEEAGLVFARALPSLPFLSSFWPAVDWLQMAADGRMQECGMWIATPMNVLCSVRCTQYCTHPGVPAHRTYGTSIGHYGQRFSICPCAPRTLVEARAPEEVLRQSE